MSCLNSFFNSNFVTDAVYSMSNKFQSLSLSIKILGYIFFVLSPSLVFGQNDIYNHSPEFISKHGIKRITQKVNMVYHQEKKIEADSSQMFEFSTDGIEIFSASYLKNERYYWYKSTLDSENRVVKNERYNTDGLQDVSEYNYLPNGDYIVRHFRTDDPKRIVFYKYFFDESGNEIRREEWNKDSLIANWDIKTYNENNLIVSSVHQTRMEDTVVNTLYYYKKDSILVRKDFYNKGELSMRTNYGYYPDGREKVTHFGDQSSWFSYYDDQGRLSKQMIIQFPLNDTIYNYFRYDEKGLIQSVLNQRKDMPQRREFFTYENGREVSKTIYTRANTFNALLETVYLGDTALIVYQTPYWEKKVAFAQYKRVDPYGNVLEEIQGNVKGKKQPLSKLMNNAKPIRHHFEMSTTGKILAKYRVEVGWMAESAFCSTYSDRVLMEDFNRPFKKAKQASCDTIKTRRHNGGKHYFVSISGHPGLTRHIYKNKSGVVDSILDINKAGVILNRMIKENGQGYTYMLLNRYEYNEMDSLKKVFKCFGSVNYVSTGNMVEEHFWKGARKVKIEKYMNYWGQHGTKNLTTVTFSYDENHVFRTTRNPQGEITEERLTYDENNRLVEIMGMDRTSNGITQIRFSYDADGNLLERTEIAIMNPVETIYTYDFY